MVGELIPWASGECFRVFDLKAAKVNAVESQRGKPGGVSPRVRSVHDFEGFGSIQNSLKRGCGANSPIIEITGNHHWVAMRDVRLDSLADPPDLHPAIFFSESQVDTDRMKMMFVIGKFDFRVEDSAPLQLTGRDVDVFRKDDRIFA